MPPEHVVLGGSRVVDEVAARAARVLRDGGVAILPAEGLYGYHARADHEGALARLRALKPRAGRGFIVLLAEPGDLSGWAAAPPRRARELIAAHWPGPLTLVLPAAPSVHPDLSASDGTVALRCPGSAFLRAVLRATASPLVSTSANRPGDPAPARASDASAEGTDLVVDAGALSGIPSTLVRFEGEALVVLRPGAVRVTPGGS